MRTTNVNQIVEAPLHWSRIATSDATSDATNSATPTSALDKFSCAVMSAARMMVTRVVTTSGIVALSAAICVGAMCNAHAAAEVPARAPARPVGSISAESRVLGIESDPKQANANELATLAPVDAPRALERDPVREATLDAVRAFESTVTGNWLRQHAVAWNALAIVVLFVLGYAVHLVLRRALTTLLTRALVRAHRERLAQVIVGSNLMRPLAAIAPLLVVARLLGVLGDAEALNPIVAINVANFTTAYAILKGLSAASCLLQVVDDLYSSRPEVNRVGALRGYRQVAMVVFGAVAGITAVAIAVGKSPLVFLAALGAVGAVGGVVFKDILLSLVANMMLSATDALRVGDWVELKQHSIDGRIAEIKTTSVRVQNADGTVHSVPISRFVQEPYLNYRSKFGTPGRRVRRSIRVDLRSIRALNAEDFAQFAAHPSSAITQALQRARTQASALATATGASTNEVTITNLGVFRAFAEGSLCTNAAIDTTLPAVLSQLEVTITGQPIEVLCFIRADAGQDLASIEAALIDRIASALPCFGLRSFQSTNDLGVSGLPYPMLDANDMKSAGIV